MVVQVKLAGSPSESNSGIYPVCAHLGSAFRGLPSPRRPLLISFIGSASKLCNQQTAICSPTAAATKGRWGVNLFSYTCKHLRRVLRIAGYTLLITHHITQTWAFRDNHLKLSFDDKPGLEGDRATRRSQYGDYRDGLSVE